MAPSFSERFLELRALPERVRFLARAFVGVVQDQLDRYRSLWEVFDIRLEPESTLPPFLRGPSRGVEGSSKGTERESLLTGFLHSDFRKMVRHYRRYSRGQLKEILGMAEGSLGEAERRLQLVLGEFQAVQERHGPVRGQVSLYPRQLSIEAFRRKLKKAEETLAQQQLNVEAIREALSRM